MVIRSSNEGARRVVNKRNHLLFLMDGFLAVSALSRRRQNRHKGIDMLRPRTQLHLNFLQAE
jgi:hypothetical protein